MIVGIGSDIVEHGMNSKFLKGMAGDRFVNRTLSEQEINHYQLTKDDNFVAGRFAAKEAILKCLGTGMINGISLKDISIIKLSTGQPEVKLIGEVKTIAACLGINNWHISISHSPSHSIAFVIAEKL